MFGNLVWDYKMLPQEFFDILENKRVLGNFNQDWAIGRVLEHTNYYDAMGLVSLPTLHARWSSVESRIFNKELAHGYNYLLQRQALSATR